MFKYFSKRFSIISFVSQEIGTIRPLDKKVSFLTFTFLIVSICFSLGNLIIGDALKEKKHIEMMSSQSQIFVDQILKDYGEILRRLSKDSLLLTTEMENLQEIQRLIIEEKKLASLLNQSHMNNIVGLRWVGNDGTVLGAFGIVKTKQRGMLEVLRNNFNESRNYLYLRKIENEIYAIIHLVDSKKVSKGFFIVPIPLKDISQQAISANNKVNKLFKTKFEYTLVNGIDGKGDYIKVDYLSSPNLKKYFYENIFYILILLSGSLILFLFLKSLTRHISLENQLLKNQKKILDFSLISYEDITDKYLGRYENIREHSFELSNLLLSDELKGQLNPEGHKFLQLLNSKSDFESLTELESCDLLEVLKKSINLLSYKISEKSIVLDLHEHDLEEKVLVNELLYFRLFTSIIFSQIKRVPKGGKISISVKSLSDGKGSGYQIQFVDNGYMVTNAQMNKIKGTEEKKNFLKFILTWEEALKLAKKIGIKISQSTSSNITNELSLAIIINEPMEDTPEEKNPYKDNIVPFRK